VIWGAWGRAFDIQGLAKMLSKFGALQERFDALMSDLSDDLDYSKSGGEGRKERECRMKYNAEQCIVLCREVADETEGVLNFKWRKPPERLWSLRRLGDWGATVSHCLEHSGIANPNDKHAIRALYKAESQILKFKHHTDDLVRTLDLKARHRQTTVVSLLRHVPGLVVGVLGSLLAALLLKILS